MANVHECNKIKMFILVILLAVAGCAFPGCARISIDRDKNIAHYTRIGSQNLENLYVEYDVDGSIRSVKLGKQHSSDLTKALIALKEVIKKLPVVPVPVQ